MWDTVPTPRILDMTATCRLGYAGAFRAGLACRRSAAAPNLAARERYLGGALAAPSSGPRHAWLWSAGEMRVKSGSSEFAPLEAGTNVATLPQQVRCGNGVVACYWQS